MSVVRELREFVSLENFTDEDLCFLDTFIEEKIYKDGDLIIQENSPTTDLMFILSGKTCVERVLGKNTRMLTTIGCYNIVGEVAFGDQKPRTANVVAVGETRIGVLRYADFDRIKNQDPVFGMKLLMQLLKIVAGKFRQVNKGLDLTILND